MHVYIDESLSGDGNVFVYSALVLYDRASTKKIMEIVGDTMKQIRATLSRSKRDKLPNGRVLELKGGKSRGKNKPYIPDLGRRRDLQDKFFKRLVKKVNFVVYVLYIDHRHFKQRLPQFVYRKYGLLLQNLLRAIPIRSQGTKLYAITVDSQQTAKPSLERIEPIVRGNLRKIRKKDRTKNIILITRIKTQLKASHPERTLHSKVWIIPSHHDRCLQAADVFAHFCQQYHTLGRSKPPYKPPKSFSKRELKWFDTFNIIKDRTWWIHNPQLVKPKGPSERKRRRPTGLQKQST